MTFRIARPRRLLAAISRVNPLIDRAEAIVALDCYRGNVGAVTPIGKLHGSPTMVVWLAVAYRHSDRRNYPHTRPIAVEDRPEGTNNG